MNNSKSTRINTQGGLIGWIILIIIGIAILSYFGFNFQAFFSSPNVQQNFSYVWNDLVYVWVNFLKAPVLFIWGFIYKFAIVPLINLSTKNSQINGNL